MPCEYAVPPTEEHGINITRSYIIITYLHFIGGSYVVPDQLKYKNIKLVLRVILSDKTRMIIL